MNCKMHMSDNGGNYFNSFGDLRGWGVISSRVPDY